MKAEKFIDPIGEIGDEFLEESETTAPAKVHSWVKWVAVAACLAIAALIAVPAFMSLRAEAEDVPDTSLPAEAIITDDARAGIKYVLTMSGNELVGEDELGSITIGLPIADYGLYLDNSGAYYLASDNGTQIYPVYVNGVLEYLVGPYPPNEAWGWFEPYLTTSDFETEALHEEVSPQHQELFDRLAAGGAGSLALIEAADGTYLFDGAAFVRVFEKGNGVDESYYAQFDENGTYIDWPYPAVESPQEMTPADLEGASLPSELIAQIRLTDTSITEPLV